MRLWRSKKVRWLLSVTALALMALAGLWIYIVATRDSISVWGYHKLRQNMPRSEVEQILGGPPTVLADMRAKSSLLEFDTQITYAPPKSRKLGDFTGTVLLYQPLQTDFGMGKEQGIWKGSEGDLCVNFDDNGRLVTARFMQRLTWRHKVAEWLPWMR